MSGRSVLASSPVQGRSLGWAVVALVALTAAASSGCARRWQARFATPQALTTLDPQAPFLKVHMHAGDVYVLETWTIDPAAGLVRGDGLHYDRNRAIVGGGRVTLRYDAIALLETNQLREVSNVGAVAGIAGAALGVFLLGCVSGLCE